MAISLDYDMRANGSTSIQYLDYIDNYVTINELQKIALFASLTLLTKILNT